MIASVLAGTSAGQTAGGVATVPETPLDRGFWMEENGQRVFAVLAEPSEQVKDIDAGQRVRITGARVPTWTSCRRTGSRRPAGLRRRGSTSR